VRAPRLTTALLRAATAELARRDADLAAVVRAYGPPPLWARRPGFATLVRIILEQQVSLASARSVYERLERSLGAVTPERVRAGGVRVLKASGFTRQKASYVSELAVSVISGALDLGAVSRMEERAARARLLAVRGLGPWSVDIYLLMALGRPDVWPQGDVALAEAMHRVKGLRRRPSAERQARIAGAWRPWRSVAARILWHHYLSERADRRAWR
jgi:DNA-3-methyladenine glycosylase II